MDPLSWSQWTIWSRALGSCAYEIENQCNESCVNDEKLAGLLEEAGNILDALNQSLEDLFF